MGEEDVDSLSECSYSKYSSLVVNEKALHYIAGFLAFKFKKQYPVGACNAFPGGCPNRRKDPTLQKICRWELKYLF